MHTYMAYILGIDVGIDFPYPVMFWIAKYLLRWFSIADALAITATIMNALGIVFLYIILNLFFNDSIYVSDSHLGFLLPFFLTFIVLSLYTVSMICLPKSHYYLGSRYLGVFSPNPYWNATYMSSRPFSIVAFFAGCKFLKTINREINYRTAIIFSVSLLLSTMTKPSFSFVYIIAFGFIIVYYFFKDGFIYFKNYFIACLFVLPSGIDLIYQFLVNFIGTNSMEEDKGIGFGLGTAWKLYSDNITQSVVLVLLFPLVFSVLYYSYIKNKIYIRVAWIVWVISFLQLFFLYEKGFRMEHINFSWGYMISVFLLFCVCVIDLLKITILYRRKSLIRTVICWLCYMGHFVYGIFFLIHIYLGNSPFTF